MKKSTMARKGTGQEVGKVGEANGIDVIWMRMGDADDYHAFDGLDELAKSLAEGGVETVERHCLYGVRAPDFEGNNYISLYWGPDPGDGSAEATRELTDSELMTLAAELGQPR